MGARRQESRGVGSYDLRGFGLAASLACDGLDVDAQLDTQVRSAEDRAAGGNVELFDHALAVSFVGQAKTVWARDDLQHVVVVP